MRKQWLRRGRLTCAAALVALLALTGVAAAKVPIDAKRADAVVLTLKGKDGTTKTFTLAELKAITTPEDGYYAGYAGFVNSASTLTPVHPVRGVRLTALLEQVGYDPTDAAATDVIVGAMDGYVKLLSRQFVQGLGIATYTDVKPFPATPLPAGLSLTAILSYEYKQPGQTVDDANPWLPEVAAPMGDGPLRLWFAVEQPTTPGCIVDGDWIVKWVNKVSVSGSTVKQWVATLRGPRKTVKLRRNDFESCYHCHKTSVKLAGRRYQGVPLYYLVGKIDDNLDNNNWGAFNRRLATKGYLIDLKNAKRKVTISSKLIAARPRGIIVAWMRDGKELGAGQGPLWLIGTKLTAKQRLSGVTSLVLRNVPR